MWLSEALVNSMETFGTGNLCCGTNGAILYAHVDADYRNRAEPADATAALSRAD